MQAIARVNRVFEDKPNGLVVDFIGISESLATATKKYSNSGGKGKPSFNLEAAVRMCLLQFEKMKRMMSDFTAAEVNAMSNGERLKWSNGLINQILKSDAETEHFLKEERKLTELVAMTNSDPKIWEIQEEVGIIQKLRQTVRKIKYPPAAQKKKNERIKDLISESINSHAIVDLAKMYDLDKLDISIIDARFQAIVKEKGSENIKVEILKRIINDELKVRMPKNIKKTANLKKELDKVLSKYHQNALDSIAAIKHLLDLAKEFQEDDKRKKELGLEDDELAFYDLLSANENLLNEKGPIQDLVHKVVKSVKKNLELDWTKKENARAAIRLAIKRELRGKVPFSELDKLLKEVMEQAEGQYGDYPMVG